MLVYVKKFKVRPRAWNMDGEMDHLMGKTIEVIKQDGTAGYYLTKDGWALDPSEVIVQKRKKNRYQVRKDGWFDSDYQWDVVDTYEFNVCNKYLAVKFTKTRREAREIAKKLNKE